VENVAHYVYRGVVHHIREKFPNQGKQYTIEVQIQETDNNFFSLTLKETI
jgi:hypothetical protein